MKKKMQKIFSTLAIITIFHMYHSSTILASPIEQDKLLRKEDREMLIKKEDEWKNSLTPKERSYFEDETNLKGIYSNSDLKIIDEALKKPGSTIDRPIYVYREITSNQLGYSSNYFYEEGTNIINRDKFLELQDHLNYGNFKGYIVAKLDPPTTNKQPAVLQLEVPKNTAVGHINSNTVVLEREQGIEITDMQIINDKGKQIIKLNGKLTGKKTQEKVQHTEERMNISLKELTGTDKKIVNLDIKGAFNMSHMLDRSEALMHQLVSNVPHSIITNTLKQLNPTGAIIFTDRELNSSLFGYTLGNFSPDTKKVTLSLSKPFYLEKLLGSAIIGGMDQDINTLIHEFGHAVDWMLFDKVSETQIFNEIYQKRAYESCDT
ncbi:ADP-ribosyltransferase [Bacillus thuringiensis]|uniref:ADP-ribosyltransferase n=3 Tax=Bacillus thuringiensis TaxID=1428 RepID=UPI000BFCAB0F|nr:ADP-ribosyltransferase [Bacillus thuringiensis]PGY41527.1 hypothetical protein COE09_26105 [Bacillus thuringiensis]